jgi:hypothetical protein
VKVRRSVKGANAVVSGERLPRIGGWHLRIGLPLMSGNHQQGAHWATRDKDRVAWDVAVQNALIVAADVRTWAQYQRLRAAAPRLRMLLVLTREVPSLRNFIRDDDDLMWSAKRLRDALKANHLFVDDSRKWLVYDLPLQKVSADGQYWTDIVIVPLPVAAPSRPRPRVRPSQNSEKSRRRVRSALCQPSGGGMRSMLRDGPRRGGQRRLSSESSGG